MFESRHRSSGGSSANRWLLVAGGGLVILAFVARMLLDIGHTKVSDLAGVLRPDTAAAATPAAVPVDTPAVVADTATAAPPDSANKVIVVASPPPVLKNDTTTPIPVPPATPAPASPSAAGSGYVIQIGAFGSEANAEKLGQRASALGYHAAVFPQGRGASTLYLVRVTGSGSAADARQASDSLAHSLGVRAVVLRPGR